MTVGELLDRLDSHELIEWMAYYQLEPFGEERADIRQAQTTKMIYDANRGKGSKELTLEDFMLFTDKAEKEADEGLTGAAGFALVKHLFGQGDNQPPQN